MITIELKPIFPDKQPVKVHESTIQGRVFLEIEGRQVIVDVGELRRALVACSPAGGSSHDPRHLTNQHSRQRECERAMKEEPIGLDVGELASDLADAQDWIRRLDGLRVRAEKAEARVVELEAALAKYRCPLATALLEALRPFARIAMRVPR